ncbi:hypothetical protein [Paenibacillus spongiae]|uniref:Uncharacterized protein n=1 Tax=Paenibacillus spongiae TaxID=2909671 RepID=A0ABY5S9N4_9BACL|nr:hypothetical protein [Paenibacillus spongiae]UVI29023.1 hypothetical protein L1F29_26840 [Paenibacillus spongiae]
MTRFILELLRVIVILLLGGAVLDALIKHVYSWFGITLDHNPYVWLVWLAIYLFIYVLYRNSLQFSGWYKGSGRIKLSKPMTLSLVGLSVFLLILPPLLN